MARIAYYRDVLKDDFSKRTAVAAGLLSSEEILAALNHVSGPKRQIQHLQQLILLRRPPPVKPNPARRRSAAEGRFTRRPRTRFGTNDQRLSGHQSV